MRPRLYILAAVLVSIVVTGVASASGSPRYGDRDDSSLPGSQIPTRPAEPDGSPNPSPAPARAPEPDPASAPAVPRLLLKATVSVEIDGFLSWAALDRATGELAGSENFARTSTTESMIKAWIVADYLRRRTEAGEEPSERALTDGSRAIRNSDDGPTERLYADGGHDNVVERMIDMCGLTDTKGYPGWWSRTETSARDAVRVGECIADGTAAGPEWTDWVLEEMRKVRGTAEPQDQPMAGGGEGGRWGIIDGLPVEVLDRGVSIKNGWTALSRTGDWHVNCLAITDDWVMAIVMQYPVAHDLEYGVERCAGVARQLVPDPATVTPAAQ